MYEICVCDPSNFVETISPGELFDSTQSLMIFH